MPSESDVGASARLPVRCQYLSVSLSLQSYSHALLALDQTSLLNRFACALSPKFADTITFTAFVHTIRRIIHRIGNIRVANAILVAVTAVLASTLGSGSRDGAGQLYVLPPSHFTNRRCLMLLPQRSHWREIFGQTTGGELIVVWRDENIELGTRNHADIVFGRRIIRRNGALRCLTG